MVLSSQPPLLQFQLDAVKTLIRTIVPFRLSFSGNRLINPAGEISNIRSSASDNLKLSNPADGVLVSIQSLERPSLPPCRALRDALPPAAPGDSRVWAPDDARANKGWDRQAPASRLSEWVNPYSIIQQSPLPVVSTRVGQAVVDMRWNRRFGRRSPGRRHSME